ncbi:hypothetical protein ACFQ36_18110 [Arthrobacter sp. GCM10027362]|uniref:hypothetical protein n=1 Tax=Arthrobacter sp. GCM10027362 TaxID=3273379 RepID=UPI00363421B6
MGTASEPLAPGQRQAARDGFVAATASFVAVFAAGATAIPLYDTYRRADGVTNAEFSLVAVGYFACAIFALPVLGRLSDHGAANPSRSRPCSPPPPAAGSSWPLLFGRGLQGLAAGLASSAIAAYAVDTAPAEPKWLTAAVTTALATIGLSLGVFASGTVLQFAPHHGNSPSASSASSCSAAPPPGSRASWARWARWSRASSCPPPPARTCRSRPASSSPPGPSAGTSKPSGRRSPRTTSAPTPR